MPHDESRRREYPPSVYIFWVIAGLGFGLRIAVALLSSGSNDILLWSRFATGIGRVGLATTYRLVEEFNHPPLMGYLAAALLRISGLLGVRFETVFKLPMILADLSTAVLLWKIWSDARGPAMGGLAVLTWSWSAVAILIGSFHGNTDNLCVFLCLLSAYSCEKQRPLLGGLALAAAINVKLIPMVLIPAFALRYRSWRELILFGSGLAAGALPFLPFFVCCGGSFYRNAVAYASNVDHWGFMLVLLQREKAPALLPIVGPLAGVYLTVGRLLIVGLAILLGVAARGEPHWNRYELGALGFAIFLIFTPGFGLQYTVYAAPFLCAVSLRWANLYSLLAGAFLVLVYHSFWTGTIPVLSMLTARFPLPAALAGLVAWALLIGFVLSRMRLKGGAPLGPGSGI